MAKTSYEYVSGIKYYYRFVELPRDSSGKRNREKIRGKTVAELNEKVDAFKNQQKLGVSNQNEKFGELFKEWLYTIHQVGKATSTMELYERLERLYITPCPLYGVKIKDLSAIKIQNWYNKAEMTPYILQSVSRLVSPFLKYLFKANYTLCDFSKLISVKECATESEVEILSKSDQILFLNNCKDNSIYSNALKFALYTGIRIGELEALTWKDIKGNKLTINKTFRYVKEPGSKYYIPTISKTKTKSSTRTITLNDKALEVLNCQKENYNLLRNKLGNKFTHPELVFTNSKGNYASPQALRTALNTVCKNANIQHIKFHALRHTFATRLIESGINIKFISVYLGHASTAVTEKVYVHVLEEFQDDTTNIINQAFATL